MSADRPAEEFLKAISDPQHEEHDDVVAWFGGDFDPEFLDLEAVEAILGRIRASRRKGPKLCNF